MENNNNLIYGLYVFCMFKILVNQNFRCLIILPVCTFVLYFLTKNLEVSTLLSIAITMYTFTCMSIKEGNETKDAKKAEEAKDTKDTKKAEEAKDTKDAKKAVEAKADADAKEATDTKEAEKAEEEGATEEILGQNKKQTITPGKILSDEEAASVGEKVKKANKITGNESQQSKLAEEAAAEEDLKVWKKEEDQRKKRESDNKRKQRDLRRGGTNAFGFGGDEGGFDAGQSDSKRREKIFSGDSGDDE
jgi:hypothetical protein